MCEGWIPEFRSSGGPEVRGLVQCYRDVTPWLELSLIRFLKHACMGSCEGVKVCKPGNETLFQCL
jgi:hypothetical protein